MEELLGCQDEGHLPLEAALAAGDGQQLPTDLIVPHQAYPLLCVHLLQTTLKNHHH